MLELITANENYKELRLFIFIFYEAADADAFNVTETHVIMLLC